MNNRVPVFVFHRRTSFVAELSLWFRITRVWVVSQPFSFQCAEHGRATVTNFYLYRTEQARAVGVGENDC